MRTIPIDPAAVKTVFIDAAPAPEYDADGVIVEGAQKRNAEGLPVWRVNVLAKVAGEDGGETMRVSVPSREPIKHGEFEPISFEGLRAIPWSQNGRQGISYGAKGITNGATRKG